MVPAPTSDLIELLVGRLREVARCSSVDERAWTLVRTGAGLRRAGSFEQAIEVLEEAVAISPAWEVERAALTCAIATHCDAGEPLLAAKIASSTCARGVDARLLFAAGRANAAAFSVTGEHEYRIAADACFRDAAALDGKSLEPSRS
jgi:hypothetical protein